MAISLKPVDVAVVGLGAAGGTAVLPLARSGLKIAGIEAGTWMDPAKDFKADEIHNNVRGMITTGSKIRREHMFFELPQKRVVVGDWWFPALIETAFWRSLSVHASSYAPSH